MCAVSKPEGKLEQIRAAAEEAELQERIANRIELEKSLDTMNEDEANEFSREHVRVVRDAHLEELRNAELERQRAEKARRRRRR